MRASTLSLALLLVAPAIAAAQTPRPVPAAAPAAPPVFGDVREDFEAVASAGVGFDTLGTQDINLYLNPEDNGETLIRPVFGFRFQYRLVGGANRDNAPQVWIYGKALHGLRSEDLECGEAPKVPSCAKEIAEAGGHIPDDALYMLRGARSLEVAFGARVELANLNLPGRDPARIYVKGEMGFMNLAGSDGDGKELRQIAGGATVVGGPRTGSYFEVGFGRSDLFQLNRYRRFKVDGMFQQALSPGVSFFAQLVTDVDFKDGSDSIQSFFGLSFDLGRMRGGK